MYYSNQHLPALQDADCDSARGVFPLLFTLAYSPDHNQPLTSSLHSSSSIPWRHLSKQARGQHGNRDADPRLSEVRSRQHRLRVLQRPAAKTSMAHPVHGLLNSPVSRTVCSSNCRIRSKTPYRTRSNDFCTQFRVAVQRTFPNPTVIPSPNLFRSHSLSGIAAGRLNLIRTSRLTWRAQTKTNPLLQMKRVQNSLQPVALASYTFRRSQRFEIRTSTSARFLVT